MGEVVIIIDETKSSKLRISRCRICHEEEAESFFEVPCACSGTVKFAHRDCIQRWCNEKGNTTCEICLQVLFFFYFSSYQFFFNLYFFFLMKMFDFSVRMCFWFCEVRLAVLSPNILLFSWIVYCVSVSSVFVFGRQVVS